MRTLERTKAEVEGGAAKPAEQPRRAQIPVKLPMTTLKQDSIAHFSTTVRRSNLEMSGFSGGPDDFIPSQVRVLGWAAA